MAAPEIIDLTTTPITSPTIDPQSLTSTNNETLIAVPTTINTSKTSGKKSRKQHKKDPANTVGDNGPSQSSTAVNTRSNSEERDEVLESSRQGKRKRKESPAGENPVPTHNGRQRASRNGTQEVPMSAPEPLDNPPEVELFFYDVTPAALPPAIGSLPPPTLCSPPPLNSHDEPKLLLPSHVSVLGSTPVEILPPAESDEEGGTDYIKYLDYGGEHKEFLRYFEEPEDESIKLSRTVCKNCAAEGDHKTADCRVLICLTCGVRDEHVTKSCPVSKVCFTCGMKGHININCPNRHMARNREHDKCGRCERCYSGLHQTSECPTWWRLYEYVTGEDKERILMERRPKCNLQLGRGGEGYIAEDEWCYNCGDAGHLGDDCKGPKRYDKPAEPSAFGLYNIASGPFFDTNDSTPPPEQRRLRDWEREDQFGDWGKFAPDNVGKQGRRKTMERMRKSAQRFEEESDPDDWFRHGKDPDTRSSGGSRGGPRVRNHERDIGEGRERDGGKGERKRDPEPDRGRDREQDRRDRRRDTGRGQERTDKVVAPNQDRNPNHTLRNARGRNDTRTISVSKLIGENRHFLPPPPVSLPTRRELDSRPNLLSRLSDARLDDTLPLSNSQPSRWSSNSPISLSIKGAGDRTQNKSDGQLDRKYERNRDGHRPSQRENSGPRYRGGYSR